MNFSEIWEVAVEVYDGDEAKAMRWLQKPRKIFKGKSALEYSLGNSDRSYEVLTRLKRMERGVIQ